jgi:hypothetical protein
MFGAWLFEWLVLLEYRFTSRYVKAGTMRAVTDPESLSPI